MYILLRRITRLRISKSVVSYLPLLFVLVVPLPAFSQSDGDKKTEKEAKERAKRERREYEDAQKEKWKYFAVTSNPPGARVEVNGEYLGTTPFRQPVKVKFFYNGPTFAFSSYLNSHMNMTVSKDGYVTKTLQITRGPYQWVSLNGVNRLIYYVVSSPEFDIQLEKVGEFLGTNPLAKKNDQSKTQLPNPSSTEQVIQIVLPAVVTVKTPSGSGSGFFILDSGVVVTNKHVVGANQTVSVLTSKGESIQSKSIYVSPNRDIALIKLDGVNYPSLQFADPASVNVGADVIAIGSPGVAGVSLQNTVTKGIISSFRQSEVNGLLVQTDAALNHGNSGGPLLNSRGEVIGINTLGFADFDKEGLNFAVFSSEILKMLKDQFDFVPEFPANITRTVEVSEAISVQLLSEPAGAEVSVNGRFVGSTPSRIKLKPGEYVIKVTRPGFKDWERTVVVEDGSEPTFNAILEKNGP